MKFKNGYLQIDLAFAILMFFILFFQILNLNDSFNFKFNLNSKLENENIIASQLCNLLLESEGIPNNWETNLTNLEVIGLLNNESEIDLNKLNILNNSNYFNITNNFDKEYIYNFKLLGIETGNNYLNFGFSPNTSIYGNSICYSFYNNETVKLIIEVWK